MRHRVNKTIFSRDTNHRKAMIRNGVRNLVEHGEIQTTKTKAKEFQRWADKLINTAQEGSLAARRQLHSFFGKRDVVNTLVDKIAPAYPARKSGFTRITYVGRRRGDNTELVKLELINKPAELGSLAKPASAEKAAPAKKAATAKVEAKVKPAGKTKPAAKSKTAAKAKPAAKSKAKSKTASKSKAK